MWKIRYAQRLCYKMVYMNRFLFTVILIILVGISSAFSNECVELELAGFNENPIYHANPDHFSVLNIQSGSDDFNINQLPTTEIIDSSTTNTYGSTTSSYSLEAVFGDYGHYSQEFKEIDQLSTFIDICGIGMMIPHYINAAKSFNSTQTLYAAYGAHAGLRHLKSRYAPQPGKFGHYYEGYKKGFWVSAFSLMGANIAVETGNYLSLTNFTNESETRKSSAKLLIAGSVDLLAGISDSHFGAWDNSLHGYFYDFFVINGMLLTPGQSAANHYIDRYYQLNSTDDSVWGGWEDFINATVPASVGELSYQTVNYIGLHMGALAKTKVNWHPYVRNGLRLSSNHRRYFAGAARYFVGAAYGMTAAAMLGSFIL